MFLQVFAAVDETDTAEQAKLAPAPKAVPASPATMQCRQEKEDMDAVFLMEEAFSLKPGGGEASRPAAAAASSSSMALAVPHKRLDLVSAPPQSSERQVYYEQLTQIHKQMVLQLNRTHQEQAKRLQMQNIQEQQELHLKLKQKQQKRLKQLQSTQCDERDALKRTQMGQLQQLNAQTVPSLQSLEAATLPPAITTSGYSAPSPAAGSSAAAAAGTPGQIIPTDIGSPIDEQGDGNAAGKKERIKFLNKEHARISRLRKKYYLQALQERTWQLYALNFRLLQRVTAKMPNAEREAFTKLQCTKLNVK